MEKIKVIKICIGRQRKDGIYEVTEKQMNVLLSEPRKTIERFLKKWPKGFKVERGDREGCDYIWSKL